MDFKQLIYLIKQLLNLFITSLSKHIINNIYNIYFCNTYLFPNI